MPGFSQGSWESIIRCSFISRRTNVYVEKLPYESFLSKNRTIRVIAKLELSGAFKRKATILQQLAFYFQITSYEN